MFRSPLLVTAAFTAVPFVCGPLAGQSAAAERIDYLTFAQGAIPVAIGGGGPDHGAGMEHAVGVVDGNPGSLSILNRATADTDVTFTYELPALTTFDRFAVPEVLETPSPYQTFIQTVEVFGSTTSAEGPWLPLARATLTTHASRGLITDLDLLGDTPVRWVQLRLTGGIEMLEENMFLEFGEIIGNGTQLEADLVDTFSGSWRGRGVRLTLAQNAATVAGCYDTGSPLSGTVSGNLLRARGVDTSTGVVSLFIAGVLEDGSVRGLRSTNGGPFRIFAAPTGQGAECAAPPEPILGCGSVVHGIHFAFDSADILPDSDPVLQALFEGLSTDPSITVTIEGHTSSEGEAAYNLALSERRARAVVLDLAGRGIDAPRLQPAGRGETTPIASNDDEAGRSLNRRVEVHCG